MEIKDFKTKYNVEDVIYFMHNNKVCKGIISGIEVTFSENISLGSKETCSIIDKIKNFFSSHKEEYDVKYSIVQVDKNGSFYAAIGGYLRDYDIAYTTEELVKLKMG